MEVKEFRELSPVELDQKVYELQTQLFELRRKKAVGQLEQPEQTKAIRKDIAKALTVKRERELQIKAEPIKK